jgi:ABC-type cobalamin/Fe3+-siderophores transport system ATPase subunit
MLFDSAAIASARLNTSEFGWFLDTLDASFCLPDNTDLAVFGFNGIGKTTLVRLLKKLPNSSYFFFDYEDDSVRSDLLSNKFKKNEVQIKIDVSQISDLETLLNNEKANLEAAVKNGLGAKMGITNATTAKKYSQVIKDAQAKKPFRLLTSPSQDISKINSLMGSIPLKALVECQSQISTVGSVTSQMKSLQEERLFSALSEIDQNLSPTDSTCPVCGSTVPHIKQVVQNLIKNLGAARNALSIEIVKKYGIQVTQNQITSLISADAMMSNSPVLKDDYFICGGDTTVYSSINSALGQISSYQTQIKNLSNKAQAAYNSVASQKQRFEDDMSNYFGAANFGWDPNNYSVSFQLPRPFSTYSTGEMNLLVFLYHIYEFLGSDKSTLILDDPVSSLDLVNHYKIAYEIVRASALGKHVVVFSHSPTLLNTLNGQYSKHFAFYYMEEYGGKRFLQQIPLSHLQGRDTCLISLKGISSSLDTDGLIADLRVRDHPGNSLDQNLFHFDTVDHFGSSHLYSNNSLIAEIDNFRALPYSPDFFANTYYKIRESIALRLWVEKELYFLINPGSAKLTDWTLAEKVDEIFDRNGTCKAGVTIPSTLTRDSLMSKKVMLNECILIKLENLGLG